MPLRHWHRSAYRCCRRSGKRTADSCSLIAAFASPGWLAVCLSIRLSVCGLWQVPKQNRKILFLSAGVPFGQRVLYLLASSWAQFNWILFRFFFFFLCGIRVTPLAACCSLFFTSLPFFLCSFCCPTVCFLIAGQQFQYFFFAGAFLLTCRRFAAVFSC